MSDVSLYIAASGLNAAQTGMDTVAENLANANTTGYIRETPDLVTLPGGSVSAPGSGVEVVGIEQAVNSVYMANALTATSQNGLATTANQTLQSIQGVFSGEPNGPGLSSQLSAFWNDWDSVAQNPTSQAPRTVLIEDAKEVVTTLNDASASIAQVGSQSQLQLSDLMSQASDQLAQVAKLNTAIATAKAAGQDVSALVDQQNELVTKLAGELGVSAQYQPDGTVHLWVAGVSVVQGSSADVLTAQFPAGQPATILAYPAGNEDATVAVTPSSGQAAALLSALNTQVPKYQDLLNQVAHSLASLVNDQLAQGYTLSGASGKNYPMFLPLPPTRVDASNIEVNPAIVANPSDIAASSSATRTNNGENAQAMAELYNDSKGPDSTFQQLIGDLGAATQAANNQADIAQSVLNSANELNQSVSGVDMNNQEVDMLTYQQAFEASAKTVATANQMMDSLLAAV
jgi:flagellar hook-associated protein 1 FlgK